MNGPFCFGTNLKMQQTAVETHAFVGGLAALPVSEPVRRFVIPPFTSLTGLAALARPAGIAIGAQNAHYAEAGAYTGEISVGMLEALDIDLVMIGHAERRTLFGETDAIIARKVAAVLRSRLGLLLCVGEGLADRRAGRTETVLHAQLSFALRDVGTAAVPALWVAYEPVWSIGEGGVAADVAEIVPAVAFIRTELHDRFGASADTVPLLYGGSVNAANCGFYAAIAGIDGLFVGRSAWSVDGYAEVMTRGFAAWRAAR